MNVLSGLNQDFEDILVELARAGAEFIVVGAYALAFHGAPRTTGDIDIWIRPTRDNAFKVHRALIAFGAPLASAGLTVDDLHHAGTVYQIGVEPRRIDILTKISGVPTSCARTSSTDHQQTRFRPTQGSRGCRAARAGRSRLFGQSRVGGSLLHELGQRGANQRVQVGFTSLGLIGGPARELLDDLRQRLLDRLWLPPEREQHVARCRLALAAV
jgi:hypothetical protein